MCDIPWLGKLYQLVVEVKVEFPISERGDLSLRDTNTHARTRVHIQNRIPCIHRSPTCDNLTALQTCAVHSVVNARSLYLPCLFLSQSIKHAKHTHVRSPVSRDRGSPDRVPDASAASLRHCQKSFPFFPLYTAQVTYWTLNSDSCQPISLVIEGEKITAQSRNDLGGRINVA